MQPNKQEDTKNYAYNETVDNVRERYSNTELAREMELAAQRLMDRFDMSQELRAQMRDSLDEQERRMGVSVRRLAA